MKSEVGFCFKIFKEWYQENRENAYLALKYPKASGALRQAPDPTPKRAHFTRTMLLHMVNNLGLSRSGPPRSNPGSAPATYKSFWPQEEGSISFMYTYIFIKKHPCRRLVTPQQGPLEPHNVYDLKISLIYNSKLHYNVIYIKTSLLCTICEMQAIGLMAQLSAV